MSFTSTFTTWTAARIFDVDAFLFQVQPRQPFFALLCEAATVVTNANGLHSPAFLDPRRCDALYAAPQSGSSTAPPPAQVKFSCLPESLALLRGSQQQVPPVSRPPSPTPTPRRPGRRPRHGNGKPPLARRVRSSKSSRSLSPHALQLRGALASGSRLTLRNPPHPPRPPPLARGRAAEQIRPCPARGTVLVPSPHQCIALTCLDHHRDPQRKSRTPQQPSRHRGARPAAKTLKVRTTTLRQRTTAQIFQC